MCTFCSEIKLHLCAKIFIQFGRHGDGKRLGVVKVRSVAAGDNCSVVVGEVEELVHTEGRRLHV